MISTLIPSIVNVDDVEESILYDLEKEFDGMLLDQDDKEEHGGHNRPVFKSSSYPRFF